MLGHLRKVVHLKILLFTGGLELLYKSNHDLLSLVLVAQVRSDWALAQLLNEDIDETVKKARRLKESLQLLPCVQFLLSNVVEKHNCEVLINANITLFIMQDVLFDLSIIHGCDSHVVDIALMG